MVLLNPTRRSARAGRASVTGHGPAEARLADLRAGESAHVTGLAAHLPEQIRRRLEDLGFDHGAEVSLLRRAPMGDPCVYRVRDYDLCLRRREAESVLCARVCGE